MLRVSIIMLGLALALSSIASAFDVTFTVIDGTASYQAIEFKGTPTEWSTIPMEDPDGDHTWVVTVDVSPGDHEWGAIENDGTEWGIWLIEGPNPSFSMDDEGNVTGTTTYYIPAPPPSLDVVFSVDMSNETVSEEGVHLAGGFGANGYPEWQPNAIPLTDDDGDDIYSVTLTLYQEASYEFKYINGAMWDGLESVPSECGVDDYNGGYNRMITTPQSVGDPYAVGYVFGSCEVISPSETMWVTFTLDLTDEIVSEDGVHLAGGFGINGYPSWVPDGIPMNDSDGNQIYHLSLNLFHETAYQFKFINGNTWEGQEQVPMECGVDDGFGGYNRMITTPNEEVEIIWVEYLFSSCEIPSGVEDHEADAIPASAQWLRNFPNPFNPSTQISFAIDKAQTVDLNVYDIAGRLVQQLVQNRPFNAGIHSINWNAQGLPSGTYVYSLAFEDGTVLTEKAILLK